MAFVKHIEVCNEKGNKMKTIEQQGPFDVIMKDVSLFCFFFAI